MYRFQFPCCTLLIILFFVNTSKGQIDDSIPEPDSVGEKDLTIAYTLYIQSAGKNGIAESYNGSMKTIFISKGKARDRLVSLMRIQSIFYLLPSPENKSRVAIVKESGKDKYKAYFTSNQWKVYNQKYDSSVCQLYDDSTSILNYPCKKAVITLKDGKNITAYYTDLIKNPMLNLIEPAFAGIPGLVLQYEYKSKKATFTYTASAISLNNISSEVFIIPSLGYQVKNFH